MTWPEISRCPTHRMLRQFAGGWLVFFLGWAAHQGLLHGRPAAGIALAVTAVAVGILGLARPQAVRWIFAGWMTLAFPVGWLVSQVSLLILFYGLITPVALFFRLVGRDLMGRKPDPGAASFWVARQPTRDIRRYFRQY
jgi:hypothetical protein